MTETFTIIISHSQYHDLLNPPTPEELALWDLEAEWENMIGMEAEDE